jgi:hypothetical protein
MKNEKNSDTHGHNAVVYSNARDAATASNKRPLRGYRIKDGVVLKQDAATIDNYVGYVEYPNGNPIQDGKEIDFAILAHAMFNQEEQLGKSPVTNLVPKGYMERVVTKRSGEELTRNSNISELELDGWTYRHLTVFGIETLHDLSLFIKELEEITGIGEIRGNGVRIQARKFASHLFTSEELEFVGTAMPGDMIGKFKSGSGGGNSQPTEPLEDKPETHNKIVEIGTLDDFNGVMIGTEPQTIPDPRIHGIPTPAEPPHERKPNPDPRFPTHSFFDKARFLNTLQDNAEPLKAIHDKLLQQVDLKYFTGENMERIIAAYERYITNLRINNQQYIDKRVNKANSEAEIAATGKWIDQLANRYTSVLSTLSAQAIQAEEKKRTQALITQSKAKIGKQISLAAKPDDLK